MRTQLTLASLAALTQAISLRQQNGTLTATAAAVTHDDSTTAVTNHDPTAAVTSHDPTAAVTNHSPDSTAAVTNHSPAAIDTTTGAVYTHNDPTVDTTTVVGDINNWIGKYHFEGATPEFLAAMHQKDINKDGTITVFEIAEALIASSPSLNRDEIWHHVESWVAEVGNEYAWYDDWDFLTSTLPMAFDHNKDGMLSRQEARDMYTFFGAGYLADEFFDQNSYLPRDKIAETVERLRYGGDQSGSQITANMSTFMHEMYNLDRNGDGIVSVREWLNLIIDALGAAAGDNSIAFDVDAMIAKCGGEGCDWLHKDDFIADVMSYGVDFSSYESLYRRFEAFSMPWVADIAFELGEWDIPATHWDFMNVARRLKYEESFAQRPADWIPYEERLVPGLPYEPTQEQVVEHTQGEIADAQQILHSLLSTADMNVTPDHIEKLHELMILLERFVM